MIFFVGVLNYNSLQLDSMIAGDPTPFFHAYKINNIKIDIHL